MRRVEIGKPDGGVRKLGIPTVLDRFIQQAVMQVLQRRWDRTFSEHSHGFRPHDAKVAANRSKVSARTGSAPLYATFQSLRSSPPRCSGVVFRVHISYAKLGPPLIEAR